MPGAEPLQRQSSIPRRLRGRVPDRVRPDHAVRVHENERRRAAHAVSQEGAPRHVGGHSLRKRPAECGEECVQRLARLVGDGDDRGLALPLEGQELGERRLARPAPGRPEVEQVRNRPSGRRARSRGRAATCSGLQGGAALATRGGPVSSGHFTGYGWGTTVTSSRSSPRSTRRVARPVDGGEHRPLADLPCVLERGLWGADDHVADLEPTLLRGRVRVDSSDLGRSGLQVVRRAHRRRRLAKPDAQPRGKHFPGRQEVLLERRKRLAFGGLQTLHGSGQREAERLAPEQGLVGRPLLPRALAREEIATSDRGKDGAHPQDDTFPNLHPVRQCARGVSLAP